MVAFRQPLFSSFLVVLMARRFLFATLAMLLSLGLAGCRGPTELFSCIDRNCFVADWCNDHSCVSCRYGANCGSGPTMPLYERTLDLPTESEPSQPQAADPTTDQPLPKVQ